MAMAGYVRAGLKVLFLAVMTVILLPLHLVLSLCGWPGAMPRLWHRGACRIIGLKAEVRGAPVRKGGVVFIGNHLSHLDIPLLGSIFPAVFVAKADVRRWPVLGWLARLQQTVFISRHPRDVGMVQDALQKAVRRHPRLIVFPEGTSSCGQRVLPFKSSLFPALIQAGGGSLTLQPFTLDLLSVNGRAVRHTRDRDAYAYYGDMVLAPHLWAFLKGRGAVLRVTFHPPLNIAANQDRKSLSADAHAVVQSALRAA